VVEQVGKTYPKNTVKTFKVCVTPRVSPRIERGKKGKNMGNRAIDSQLRAKISIGGANECTQNWAFSRMNLTEWLQSDMKSRAISTDWPLKKDLHHYAHMVERYHCEPVTL
jgi:hypothetical protein